MASTTLQLSNETIEKLKQFYASNQIQTKNPYAAFTAKIDDCTITVYTSKKVLFQGTKAEEESQIWSQFSNTPAMPTKTHKKTSVTALDSTQFFPHIGSDEVGTGDYFGPMTVCATYVDEKIRKQLEPFHIQDSKGMTDSYICKIAPKLKTIIPFSFLILPNEKYNDLNARGYNQGKMKAYLHNQAILHLLKKLHTENNPPKTIIDQFAEKSVYYNYLKNVPNVARSNVYFETKAENKYLAVACGSVLARYGFLQKMEQMSKQWGMEIPKGAGAKVDQLAAQFIQKYGIENLGKVAKLHFANTEKAKKLLK